MEVVEKKGGGVGIKSLQILSPETPLLPPSTPPRNRKKREIATKSLRISKFVLRHKPIRLILRFLFIPFRLSFPVKETYERLSVFADGGTQMLADRPPACAAEPPAAILSGSGGDTVAGDWSKIAANRFHLEVF